MPAYIDPQVAAIQAGMPPSPDVSYAAEDRLASARTLRAWSAGQLGPRASVFTGVSQDLAIPCRWGAMSARVFRPTAGTAAGTVLWFHGGGMILGDLAKGDFAASELAQVSGLTVINIEYRLAPEHPFPAGIEDALDAVTWLHSTGAEHGFDTTTVVVGGESAGATISATAALLAVMTDGPRIDFQFLAYPKVDHVGDYPSIDENLSEGFDRGMFDFYRDCYLGAHARAEDPLISPVFAAPEVLAKLPAALILTADADPIRDEAERYAGQLAAAGVEVTCMRAVGHTHGILDFTADAISARRVAHAAYGVARQFASERSPH